MILSARHIHISNITIFKRPSPFHQKEYLNLIKNFFFLNSVKL